jgi:hypothetical protein
MKEKLIASNIFSFIGSLFSGLSHRQYKSMDASENTAVISIVSASFTTSSISKSAVNNHAYIALMTEAQKTHDGNIDIHNITWAIKKIEGPNREYAAIGKVIKIGKGF